jgi:hypothetical protein
MSIHHTIRSYRPEPISFDAKFDQKLIRKSLETNVFSVAKQRLPDKVCELHARHESVERFADGIVTVGDAVRGYEAYWLKAWHKALSWIASPDGCKGNGLSI